MSKNRNTTKKDISTVNKAAYVRYMLIDECLSTPGDGMTKKEIQAKISKKLAEIRGEQNVREIDRQEEGEEYNDGGQEISIRQIEYDLNNMEEIFKFPFDLEECKTKDGRLVKYKYPDKNFSIRNMPISSTEAIHLQAVLEMLSRLKGLPQQKWINEAIEKLSELHSVDVENVVEFDRSDFSISEKLDLFYGPLYDALIKKRVVRVKWMSFKEGLVEALIHPYLLKQYNHRWYLIGKSNVNTIKIEGGFEGILNVPIDRMIPYSEGSVIGYEAKVDYESHDMEEFYSDLVGVTFTKEGPMKVKFRVSDSLKPYIISKPIHESQTVIKSEINTFVIEVHNNYELRSLLRSHGVGLEVLEPLSLREEMKRDFETLVEMYNK